MPNMPMLQVVTRVPLQLIELKFWKFSKLDAWPYNCPFLLCLFLSFFFYFLLFSSDLNTTSHKKVIFLSASSFGCSTCLLLQPSPVVSSELRFIISSPSPVCFFFSSFLWSVSSSFTCHWVFPLLRFSIFYLLHEVSSVLSFFSIFVVCLFHLHFQFLLWFSVEFLFLCMFSS